ncbi:flagellar basal body P-ring protein FlgI [Paludibacterium paludis]|uniref:Flagellar P-ring protein n=1 Tax=Paludibacterium paludis TaxID=1225769 RepID=A0A918P611_9NEIS|nr:flagellar basal body P-ring protein FlgI [Paludibacterium paludis]GGY28806.1 flagellar P-ring protein [Paludibacterium paludis]
MRKTAVTWLRAAILSLAVVASAGAAQRVKDLTRFEGWRDNQLVGYGLVTGLAGSGDSPRNKTTQQSLANMLKRFDLTLPMDELSSRNVAAVMVTATLPALSEPGSKIDVTVTSMGDARSLLGGALLQTPLKGSDGQIYSLAQGAISVGGYRYDSNGNVVQKNHPTVGQIPEGGIVEKAVFTEIVKDGRVRLILNSPDYTTAHRIAASINQTLKRVAATPLDAHKISVAIDATAPGAVAERLSRIESVVVQSDERARVVINERTGTVVAGGNATLSAVTIVQGALKIAIVTDYSVSQPGGLILGADGVRSVVVPQTRIDVSEPKGAGITLKGNSTIADLVAALNRVHAAPRDIIAVLQAARAAGALHAELIIQ